MKLDGIRVLDLSLFLPGPHLTMMMADHGADVLKIEPYPAGEPVRDMPYRKNGFTVWFRNTHRGKKSLRLNLKAPEGQKILLQLAREADVFVEAFRPGVAKRLGIDYDAICAVNPRIVYASVSAFGQTGRYAQKPAHDLAVQALSGLVACNLGIDGKPTNPHMPVADMAASLMALSGILMALLRREKTGKGDFIDVAMLDAQMAWTPNSTGPVFAEQRAPVVKEERSWGGSAMYRLYETEDGRFIALGGSEHKFAENLLRALGREDLFTYAHIVPGPGQDPLKRFYEETFRAKPLSHWLEFLDRVDCCWAPVRDLKEAFDDPHLRERGMLRTDAQGNDHIGVPILFRNEPGEPDFHVPELGEHADEILQRLGYDDAAIEKLRTANVI
jgi:crotonobetainyl-CoA:carnitine CoA-transferase CaiB-like acyl-CoA transferase